MAMTLGTAFDAQTGRFSANGVDWPIVFLVNGATDEVEASAFALANVPETFGNAALEDLEIVGREGLTTFRFRAKYSTRRRTPINETPAGGTPEAEEIEWDLSGETVHITEALSTRRFPATAPDTGRLIGVDKDQVRGCDIEDNVETYTVHATYARSAITDTLRNKWRALRGCTNNAPFRTFPTGSVRFVNAGFRYSGSDNHLIRVAFKFIIKPNKEDVAVDEGGPFAIPVIPLVTGWEVVDVYYSGWVDNTTNKQLMRASHVAVHQVFRSGDFADLGINT